MSRFRRALQAWHGSPHDYDEFKDEAIGSGEGAQVYGHGHYVAEARPVAEKYRDELSKRVAGGYRAGWHFKGEHVSQHLDDPEEPYLNHLVGILGHVNPYNNSKNAIKSLLKEYGAEADKRQEEWLTHLRLKSRGIEGHTPSDDGSYTRALVNWLEDNQQHFKFVKSKQPDGRLYEVHVALGDDEILDWDQKLSDHHPDAQKKFLKFAAPSEDADGFLAYHDGKDLLRLIKHDPKDKKTPAETSQSLLNAGIRGIRYRDAGSRQPSADVYLDGEKVEEFNHSEHHKHREALDPDWGAASHLAIWARNNIGNTVDLDLLIHRLSGIRHKDAVSTLNWLRQNKHRVQLKPSRGTYNYVVFDPKDIRIVRKYGLKNELIKDFGTEPVHLTNVEGDHQHG